MSLGAFSTISTKVWVIRAMAWGLLCAGSAALVAIMIDVPRMWLLSERHVETLGVIERLEPNNHDLVVYSFTVRGTLFVNHTTTRGETYNRGQKVAVYFDPDYPDLSTLRAPSSQARGGAILSLSVAFLLSTLCLVVLIRRNIL